MPASNPEELPRTASSPAAAPHPEARILILHATAGSGHKRAAQALERAKGLPRRRLSVWVPAAIIAAAALGYLWGSRQAGGPLAEPLQLRLEHSLGTHRP